MSHRGFEESCSMCKAAPDKLTFRMTVSHGKFARRFAHRAKQRQINSRSSRLIPCRLVHKPHKALDGSRQKMSVQQDSVPAKVDPCERVNDPCVVDLHLRTNMSVRVRKA